MAMIVSTLRNGLYDTTVVLLKYLLAPLGVCVIVLFVQLRIKPAEAVALLDATPISQTSRDRSFVVAFYPLRVFAGFEYLTISCEVVEPKQRSLGEHVVSAGVLAEHEKKSDEQGRAFPHSVEFELPQDFGRGEYKVKYEVTFYGRNGGKDHKKPGGLHTVIYDPSFCVKALVENYAVPVRERQRALLPREWAEMELSPTANDVRIETYDNPRMPWIRALRPPAQDQERVPVELRSTRLVSRVDRDNQGRYRITTRTGASIAVDSKTRVLHRCFVPPLDVGAAQLDDRVAFIPRPNETGVADLILLTRAKQSDGPDVTLTLLLSRNEPPGSTYDRDVQGTRGRRTVQVRADWYYEEESGSEYYNLNRYIIDRDGQDPDTGAASVRVRNLSILREGDYTMFETPLVRSADGDFRLKLTKAGRDWRKSGERGTKTAVLLATDELPRDPIEVVISR